MDYRNSYSDCYGIGSMGKCRSKEDWAGVSFRDAFKANLDYSVRLTAQRHYYQLCKNTQLSVVRHINPSVTQSYVPKVKPQIGPAYTSYPSALAITASLGLTAFLEYQQCVKEKILNLYLNKFLENPSVEDQVNVDQETYKRIALVVTENVQARLLLEDLSKLRAIGSIEIYRFFLASQETLKFQSVPEIIRAVIFFGDLIPDWSKMDLHPMIKDILHSIALASEPFFQKLPSTKPQYMIELGSAWVRAVCLSLSPFLPPPETEDNRIAGQDGSQEKGWAFSKKKDKKCFNQINNLAPLNAKRPPTLFEDESSFVKVAQTYGMDKLAPKNEQGENNKEEKTLIERAVEIIQQLAQSIDLAGGQSQSAEDMRSDLLEQASRISGFKESPIQGNPADGNSVTVSLGDGQEAVGEIYDRAMELSDDFVGLEALLESARPMTEQLRRTLYPNLVHMPEMERIRSSGALDPERLPLADVCPAIFRRYRVEMQPDKRGKPVLLIVCDGSGSLYREPTWMLKNITCAWLNATVGKSISVLAGVYNTDIVRSGIYAPLVKWLYHPKKTPAIGRRDAIKALVSLPDTGTGGQGDVLSLAFMMKEAEEIARGRMIYLVHITDCQWVISFANSKSARQEVYDYYQASYRKFEGRLHTTLVALGLEAKTGLEDLLDKVIPVNKKDLMNPSAVAAEISLYIAYCMKEQRKSMNRR